MSHSNIIGGWEESYLSKLGGGGRYVEESYNDNQ